MKVSCIVALLLIGLGVVSAQEPGQHKIDVHVLLGSLCPDSIRFIQDQVYPLYNDVKDHVNFHFVPFGKAHSNRFANGTLTFTCQHGVEDCQVSRLQLCALDELEYYYGQDVAMEYVACQMAFNSDRTGVTCANQVGYPIAYMDSCYKTVLGDLLQRTAERLTNAFQNPLDWVPTTVFDLEFDAEVSRRAEFNLREVICEHINNAAPICTQ